MKTQNGFALSELLVSLLLTSIILAISMQCYLSNKRQYLETQKILDKQFEIIWIADLLRDAIRRAGFTPCRGVDQLDNIDTRGVSKTLKGIRFDNTPKQLIQMNRMNEVFTELLERVSASKILVSTRLNPKYPLIIADCHHAEVHRIAQIEKSGSNHLITLETPLQFSYTDPAYVGEWIEQTWFIQKNSSGQRSLYYKVHHTEELSPLIHSLTMKPQLKHRKLCVEVLLGLEQSETYQIISCVRGS